MTASSTPERLRLLSLVADHLLEHGVNDVSLSSLARAVGSNNRMLLYYFGSKEQLLDEAALAALERFPGIQRLMESLEEEGSAGALLERAWQQIADPDNRPFLGLFFELFSLNTRHPERNAGYFQRIGSEWPAGVARLLEREGFEPESAHECGTAIVALWRGLQIFLLAGRDPRELQAAHRRLLASILNVATTR